MNESFLKELMRRRIPQVLGVYLAAGWGLLEFTDWATRAFGFDPTVTLLVLGGWAVLLPLVLFLGWRLAGSGPSAGHSSSSGPAAPPIPAPVDWTDGGASDVPSVAVLAFANLGHDPGDDYLGDGLTDEILTALSRVEGVRVASRTSGFAFKGSQLDIRDIGTRMGVGAILEGSVRREGDRIRVATQLVDVRNGYQLWADRYDRRMDDLLSIEEEIAGKVAVELEGVLRRPPEGRRPPDPRAYEHFLRGRHYFRQWKKRALLFARDMFRRATEEDPEFARAWAGIANSIYMLSTYYPSAQADLGEALEASQRALDLAPDLAESHSAHGAVLFLQGNAEGAADEFQRAIELDPTLFDAHYFFARANFQLGRLALAEELFTRASQVDPDDYQAIFFRAQSIEAQGRHDEALVAYAEALERAEAYMDLFPDDARAATMRAVSLCRLGRAEEGLDWGGRALDIDPEDAGVRYNVACLYALEGMTEEALDCLEEAIEVGFGNREWLKNDPDIANLRDHPRFPEIMARAGN